MNREQAKPMHPFAVEPPSSDLLAKWRMRKMLAWMQANGSVELPILDIGSPSQASQVLARAYGRHNIYHTAECDFDVEVFFPVEATHCQTVTCFEVLEHVMNPLAFLRQLRLPNLKTLYLSTPARKPWVESMHLTEYTRRSLDILVERAGFKVERYACMRTIPVWWGFTGFRPLARLAFQRYHFYELKP